MSFNIALLIMVWILVVLGHLLDVERTDQILAAIKDSGCSTHPHKVIEQKQIKDTYNMKGFE